MIKTICQVIVTIVCSLIAYIGMTPLVSEAVDLPITSPFGWRYEFGTPIPALFDGLVVSAGNFGDGYGNQVLLYHEAYDIYTRYAHMQKVYVTTGTTVTVGSFIGEVGSTGNSTGPHVHIEYIVRGIDGYEYADPSVLWE